MVISYPLYFHGVKYNVSASISFFFFFFLIWALFFSWWDLLKFYQFFLSFKRTSLYFNWFFKIIFSLLFNSIFFMISFQLIFEFCFSFSSSFRCKIRLFIWDFSCFLKLAYITVRLHLRTAFAAPHRFWIVTFSFVSRYFLISSLISSVIHWLFSSILFSLHIFVFFRGFFF